MTFYDKRPTRALGRPFTVPSVTPPWGETGYGSGVSLVAWTGDAPRGSRVNLVDVRPGSPPAHARGYGVPVRPAPTRARAREELRSLDSELPPRRSQGRGVGGVSPRGRYVASVGTSCGSARRPVWSPRSQAHEVHRIGRSLVGQHRHGRHPVPCDPASDRAVEHVRATGDRVPAPGALARWAMVRDRLDPQP